MSPHRLIFVLIVSVFWLSKAMVQLIAIFFVLGFAMYAWMGLGMAWLVLPNKPAVARSTRKFNRWLGRTFRAIR